MCSWLKRASLKPSSRRSTARCGCFEPPSPGKPPRAANAHGSWADRPAIASTPTSTSTIRARPRERARSSLLPRRCCGPCPPPRHPRHGTCTARRRRSSSKRPSNRPKVRRPASASREARGTTGARKARALGAHGRRSGASRQPGAHAGQGAAPRHARASPRWRRPQRYQHPADGQRGDAGNGGLPPLTRWAL
jgi:hypothetical protein